MKVVVFLELGADVRIPPERDPRSGRVRKEWLVLETDPGSARALDLALGLKAAQPGTEVTAVHFGPQVTEPWLRQALARGCDRVVRVWDEEAAEVRAPGKAVILAAAAEAAGFDLVLAGVRGVINGGDQFGILAAAHLGVPCVTQVVGVAPQHEAGGPDVASSLEISRALDQGFRERVEAVLPVVATVAADESTPDAARPAEISAAALLAAQESRISVWDLAELGVPRERVRQADRPLRYGRPRPRRPRLHRLAAPESSLPAFDRILELVRGSVQTRQGRIVRQPPEAVVDEIFATLKDEGWLDHLRPSKGGVPEAGDNT
jgi:electron transfer flavoprotein beta subunit